MSKRSDPLPFMLAPVPELQAIKGIEFAAEVRFRQLLFTGPPGSGKTTLVRRIGGWPEEGYVDLALKGWWKAQALALRPREIHLGFPFDGQDESLALFEPTWRAQWRQMRLDLSRVRLPPPRRHFWSVDWHARFVFEFLLPDPQLVLDLRQERAAQGTHPVDERLDPERIRRQVALFAEMALHFHRQGLSVFVRDDLEGAPSLILDQTTEPDAPAEP